MEKLLGIVGIHKNQDVVFDDKTFVGTEISDGLGPITHRGPIVKTTNAVVFDDENFVGTEISDGLGPITHRAPIAKETVIKETVVNPVIVESPLLGEKIVTTEVVQTQPGFFSSLFGTKKIDHIESKDVVVGTTFADVRATFDEKDIIVEKAPVIHETIRTERTEEIQPIIHREIEQPEIHRVTQPFYEKIFKGTTVSEKQLNAEYRADTIVAPSAEFIAKRNFVGDRSTTDYTSSNTIVEKAPIVYEHRIKSVIEEIQPVIHREVVKPELVKETLNIYEKYVEAPILVEETREAKTVFVDKPLEIRKI